MDFIIYPIKTPIFAHVLNYPIRYYGLIMALAFVIGVFCTYFILVKKYSKQEAEILLDYSPFLILFSLIGARVFYVLGTLNYYLDNPLEIVMINHGGLSIFGAIFFGVFGLWLLSKKCHFSFLNHLDVIAVVFPLCQAIGRFGNYFNQEAFGTPSNCFIKLFVDEIYRPLQYKNVQYFHPTFLYESILDFLLFVVLFMLIIQKKSSKAGFITCIYLISYSIIRFLIESIRIDSVMNIFGLHIVQIICIFVFVLSIIFLFLLHKKRTE